MAQPIMTRGPRNRTAKPVSASRSRRLSHSHLPSEPLRCAWLGPDRRRPDHNGVLGFCHMDRVTDASEGGIDAATVPGVGALLRAHIPKHGTLKQKCLWAAESLDGVPP